MFLLFRASYVYKCIHVEISCRLGLNLAKSAQKPRLGNFPQWKLSRAKFPESFRKFSSLKLLSIYSEKWGQAAQPSYRGQLAKFWGPSPLNQYNFMLWFAQGLQKALVLRLLFWNNGQCRSKHHFPILSSVPMTSHTVRFFGKVGSWSRQRKSSFSISVNTYAVRPLAID
jgi:hypothetical protein